MLKWALKIILIFIAATLIAFLFAVRSIKGKIANMLEDHRTTSAATQELPASFRSRIGNMNRGALKNIAKKVKSIVYKEAGEHNPPGDMVPDEIDDEILGSIKENIKQ